MSNKHLIIMDVVTTRGTVTLLFIFSLPRQQKNNCFFSAGHCFLQICIPSLTQACVRRLGKM